MLKMTPEAYIQVRMMNGSNWLTSSKPEPQRGQDERAPDVEQGLQHQDRQDQEPVPGERLAVGEDDHEQHDEREQQLLQFDDHVAERQAAARERQRPDQRQVVRITVEEVMQARWVKLNTKMPVTRNGM